MSIVIRFVGDAGPFLGSVKDVKKGLGNVSSEALENAKKMAKWGAGVASAAAVAGLAVIKHSSDAAREIKNLAQVANASTSDFQAMAYGARSVGVENKDLADILKDVNDRIGDFVQTGGGPMADFFEKIGPKIGVTIDQFRKLSGPAALQLYYDSLQKANLSQEDLTFYLEAISSQSTSLIPLLKDNGKQFKTLAKEAQDYGFIISEFDIDRLDQMKKRFGIIEKQTEAAKNQIALGLLPVAEQLADKFIEIGDSAGGFEKATQQALKVAAKGVGFVADAVQSLRVVWKGVELTASALGAAVLTSYELIVKGISKVIDFGIDKINYLIENANRLPHISITKIDPISNSPFVTGLSNMAETARATTSEVVQHLHDMAMTPLPSTAIEQWVQDAIAAAEVAKAAFKPPEQQEQSNDGDAPVLSGVDALTAEQQKERLAILQSASEDEAEIRKLQYQQEIADINEFYEGKTGLKDEWDQVLKDKESQFQRDIYNIRKEGSEGIMGLLKDQYGWEAAESYKTGKQVLGIMAGHSKKAFELNKKIGIAEALISTYQGIAAGLKLGWPMAIPAVAYAAATGFAQIQKLRSTQYGGGGGGSSHAATAHSSSQASSPAQEQRRDVFDIRVRGLSGAEMIDGDAMNMIFDSINDKIRDGYQLGSIGLA